MLCTRPGCAPTHLNRVAAPPRTPAGQEEKAHGEYRLQGVIEIADDLVSYDKDELLPRHNPAGLAPVLHDRRVRGGAPVMAREYLVLVE